MKYEILEANNYYHIFNQGNNGENIFIEEINYSYFLRLLKKHILPIADVFSYCLLKNHFHLLVRIKDIQERKLISKAFSNFFNAYSKSINKKYNRSGSLFRDRFKRLIVYINLNPVRHQFVSRIEEYKHSSYISLLSEKETLLKREEVILLFESRENLKYYLTQKKLELDEKMSALILE